MNKTFSLGNLTDAPELRKTSSGKSYTSFSLAVNRMQGEERKTDYLNIVAWERTAENICKYCVKGSKLLVEGRIQNRTYQAQDGTRKFATEIVAEKVVFVGSKSEASAQKSDSVDFPKGEPIGEPEKKAEEPKEDPFKEFGEEVTINPEDLPW